MSIVNNNNNTLDAMNQYETTSWSNFKNILIVVSEIVIVFLLVLLKILHKLANNGWNFKSSWFKIKSVDKYRRRFRQREIQQRAMLNVIECVNERSLAISSSIYSNVDSSQPIYTISTV
ncbi:unnamed protein product [Rotaria sp. Silwood2]|nr:unnamed protein product [Rotaria sp. Silwood2]